MWKRQDNDTLNERRNAELRKSQFAVTARSSIGFVAGAGFLTVPGTREAPKGDGFEAFKKAFDAAPAVPLFKHESPEVRVTDREVADNAPEQARRALNLIKAAHASAAVWNPFAESQTSPIAKLHAQVGINEVGEIDIERGEIRISKAR